MSNSCSINIPIPKEGIINYYSNKGYNDVVFVVEGEEISSVSLFLKEKNVVLKNMIEDEKRENKISLDKVSVVGFTNLLNYYGYGNLNMDENNCVDILMVCICYNELKLLEECKKYIMKNCSIKLIQRIFNEIPINNYEPLKEIKLELSDYLSIYGYELIKDENLNDNNIELLTVILSMNNFVIKSENYLFHQLQKIENDRENKNDIIKLYKDIKKDELEEKELKEILKENGIEELKENESINRLYIDSEPTNNEIFNKWFYLYCLKNETNNRLIGEERDYLYQLSLLNLQSLLPQLFNSKTVSTLSNTVDLINDFKLEYSVELKFIYHQILNYLSSEYKFIQERFKTLQEDKKNNSSIEEDDEEKEGKDDDDENVNENEEKQNEINKLQIKKDLIIKILLLFCNNFDYIPLVKYECEDDNIFINFYQFLPKYNSLCYGLFAYYKSRNQNQQNISTNDMVYSYFRYAKDKYYTSVFHLPLIIKSEFIGEKCEFSISSYSNIVCDKYTGDLTVNGTVNGNFTVKCKNERGSISREISIEVIDIGEGYKSNSNIYYNSNYHKVEFMNNGSISDGYFVFNKCFKEGIYEIKCNCGKYMSIFSCTTRENKDERYYRGRDNYNKQYNICEENNDNVIILFDLDKKEIGYRKENENDFTFLHRNIITPIYLMIKGDGGYFEIKDIERTK